MKKFATKFYCLPIILALVFSTFTACRQEEETPVRGVPTVTSDEPSEPIVVIESPISKVEFYISDDGIAVGEELTHLAGGKGILDKFQHAKPDEIFEALTDESVAMPIEIARDVKNKTIRTKRQISYEKAKMRISSKKMVDLLGPVNASNTRTSACYNHATFESEICTQENVHPGAQASCHSYRTSSLSLVSNKPFDSVDTWTNKACGTVTINFFTWRNNAWIKEAGFVKGNGIWRYKFFYSTERPIYVIRVYNGGQFMRAATQFYNR